MQPLDFFRNRIDAMINLIDPLAVLATRLPWGQIGAFKGTLPFVFGRTFKALRYVAPILRRHRR